MAPVKSADRVLDILELLASTGRAMTHAEIGRRTAIPKSSLTQLLRNLAERGYVEPLEGSAAFRLGDGAFAVARRGARTRELVDYARPFLEQLTAATGESSGLSLLNDDMAERICSVDSSHAVLYAMHVGVRAPLYANSGGKIFLAWMAAAEREAYFRRVKLVPLTNKTILSIAALHRQLHRIKSEGIASSIGEFTPGIVGVAAPILDIHGKAVAAVGVALPSARFDDTRQRLIEQALRNCAQAIGAQASRRTLSEKAGS
ncbi:IclR family transcriptional regulator [Variovorax sp. J22R115]|uniref:IclR family transcriptional regulator n=1 Tax=Variovorax sp. J22R115 TaxID=3053509 RepID=UPI0025778E8C|nr:IclR family transcriptional regulator [Variovorax sp. J22R115]MDM0048820.1 IclR family transcriptional regulator [Variovorax sp. J22R115]